jgi:hypothetical protein
VKFFNAAFNQFDKLILFFVRDEERKKRAKLLEADAMDYNSVQKKILYDAYDAIDTKAAAVLQHVSIMTAVAGVLFSQTDAGFFRWVLGIETLVYLILALSCLRLLMTDQYYEKELSVESVARQEGILEFTAKITFLVSVVLIVTVFAKLVVK